MEPPDGPDGDSKLSPVELYREYYRLSYGKEIPQDLEREFVKLLKEAEEQV